ncbi:hypothetical protein SAMN06264849_11068 [Melghirimyces algeriensis]|uniref:Uncharacterized protein n=1 Tax=Melghirimyces algeriensis TaxID=910412 RepID=A0A521ETF7_9BACL|nr:hypothetical protein SAMN06264849_11068 [Melghirimyces algeriensis]
MKFLLKWADSQRLIGLFHLGSTPFFKYPLSHFWIHGKLGKVGLKFSLILFEDPVFRGNILHNGGRMGGEK